MIMNITLRQLQIFMVVSATQSYTRAAEQLHMTQPAVSMQIKHLEENISLSLFERQGKKIVITQAGKRMLLHAESVISQYNNMLNALNQLKNEQYDHIKVSAATTANHFITQQLAEFSRLHHDIHISLDITNRQSLVTQLQNYGPDFVIMGEPPGKLDLDSKQIMVNPLVVICSAEHELAKHTKKISMSEIIKERFVVREEGSGTKATIRRHFKKFGFDFISSFEMSSNESIKHATVAGLGLGIVALHTIKLELEAGKLVVLDVENFPLKRYWHLVSRKGKKLSPAAIAFQGFIMNSAESYQKSYGKITPF